jgi:hypothetical protein
MKKFSKGKIYKIVCNLTKKIYIGSTCESTLARRLAKHVSYINFYIKNNKTIHLSSYDIIKGGDYYIELIELFPCNSKDELFVREKYYIDLINCINKNKPISTLEEKKEYSINYTKQNKNKIKEYSINYRKKNEDILKKKNNEWIKNNKKKLKEYQKIYRDKNKDAINARRRELRKQEKETI